MLINAFTKYYLERVRLPMAMSIEEFNELNNENSDMGSSLIIPRIGLFYSLASHF